MEKTDWLWMPIINKKWNCFKHFHVFVNDGHLITIYQILTETFHRPPQNIQVEYFDEVGEMFQLKLGKFKNSLDCRAPYRRLHWIVKKIYSRVSR